MTDDIEIMTLESVDIDSLKASEKSVALTTDTKQQGQNTQLEVDDPEKGGSSNSWIGGLVLIGIGVAFLIANFTSFQLENWWALFILIPAFSTLGHAFRVYRRDGHLGHEGRGSLIGGMIMMFVSAAFLFNWNWGTIWPYFLIIGGVGLLLNALLD